MDNFQIQALVTFLSPFAIQLAKRSQSAVMGWISANSKKVNMGVSFLTSLITNAGVAIHHAAPGHLEITYPDLPTAIHGLTGFAVMVTVQFLAQGALYDQFVKHILPAKK